MERCRICEHDAGNRPFTAREMMFGTRDTFRYFECSACGCLQIAEIPPDLSAHYPPDYYSMKPRRVVPANSVRSFLARLRARHGLLGSNRLPILRSTRYDGYRWFKKTGVNFRSRILDVGCGSGERILQMAAEGFADVTGQDLFVAESIAYPNGVRVLKTALSDLRGPYDLVMLHHSFEHMPDPLAALADVRRLVAPGGFALIRIPVASYAWRSYGPDWVGVDAPRHLFIPAVRSMAVLADRAGFETTDVVFDSGALQFWASELIRKDIPIIGRAEGGTRSNERLFTKRQMRAFKRRAAELNRAGEGDAACFYWRRRD